MLSRQQVIQHVHQWGSGTVVDSILDPSCHIFSTPGVQGLVGYYMNRRCAVVFGDPVCALDDRARLVDAFHAFCDKQKKNVVYLVASETFAKWMQQHHSSALITFGNELFLDPQSDPRKKSGKNGISLRGKIRQAEKSSVLINEYEGEIPEIENKIQDIATQWLQHRQGPQIYISRVRLFAERFGKRWFYATHGDRLVASLVLNQLHAKSGWGLDRIMTAPNAPQGTSELLVVSVMERIAQEGCRFLTFGATNGTNLGDFAGFGKCTSFFVPRFYKAALKIFNLQSRGKYWEKFHPQSTPAFIVFKNPRLGIAEASCLMQALNVSFFNKKKN